MCGLCTTQFVKISPLFSFCLGVFRFFFFVFNFTFTHTLVIKEIKRQRIKLPVTSINTPMAKHNISKKGLYTIQSRWLHFEPLKFTMYLALQLVALFTLLQIRPPSVLCSLV